MKKLVLRPQNETLRSAQGDNLWVFSEYDIIKVVTIFVSIDVSKGKVEFSGERYLV